MQQIPASAFVAEFIIHKFPFVLFHFVLQTFPNDHSIRMIYCNGG